MATLPFATALIVFASALVEEKLAWNTPVPSVVPLAAGLNAFPVPVAPTATAAPGIGFEKVSRTVTVMTVVLVPLLAVIVPIDAVSVDLLPAGVVLGLIVNPLLVAPTSVPDEATRVYPVPVLSMLKFPNAAAPPEGTTLVVPDSTPV